jgi:DNA-binding NarL/FixJ family response regulator
VDDNESFLAASSAVLQRQGVCVIAMARTVAEGLLSAEEHTPDLILTDIDLGDESGFDLVRQLAGSVRAAPGKVILISAHPEDDFADLVSESHAVGFISKSDLSKPAIEAILGRPAPAGDGD